MVLGRRSPFLLGPGHFSGAMLNFGGIHSLKQTQALKNSGKGRRFGLLLGQFGPIFRGELLVLGRVYGLRLYPHTLHVLQGPHQHLEKNINWFEDLLPRQSSGIHMHPDKPSSSQCRIPFARHHAHQQYVRQKTPRYLFHVYQF